METKTLQACHSDVKMSAAQHAGQQRGFIYAPELHLPTATEREEMEWGGSGGDGGEETCPSGCPGEREPCRGGPGDRL